MTELMFSSKPKEKKGVQPVSSNGTQSVSVLTEGTGIEGNLNTGHDLRLEGKIAGQVRVSGKVVLGPSGTIEGELHANEAVIHGRVKGNLFVKGLLHLAKSAVIEGDITASQFSVEEGAVYIGKCQIGGANSRPKE